MSLIAVGGIPDQLKREIAKTCLALKPGAALDAEAILINKNR